MRFKNYLYLYNFSLFVNGSGIIENFPHIGHIALF